MTRRTPARRTKTIPQQLAHRPNLRGQACRLSRRAPQTPMHMAEVVDTAEQMQPRLQGLARAGQVPCTPRQDRQARPKRGVQALDVARREHALAHPVPQPDELAPGSLDQAHYLALFDLLHHHQRRPRQHTRSARPAGLQRPAKRPAEGLLVGPKPVAKHQKRPHLCTTTHKLGQAPGGGGIASFADEAAEPQARRDAQGREEVDQPPLGGHEDLIDLHVLQALRHKHQKFMHCPAMLTGLVEPSAHGPALKAKGGFDGCDGTAICDQSQHDSDRLGVSVGVVEDGALAFGEGPSAFSTAVASAFAAVDLDVASLGMSSSHTVHVRTEGSERVHAFRASEDWGISGSLLDADPLCFV